MAEILAKPEARIAHHEQLLAFHKQREAHHRAERWTAELVTLRIYR